MHSFPSPDLIDKAVALARALQERATELQSPAEKRQQAELDRMLQTPSDKSTLMQMTDQAFRSGSAWRTVDQFTHILDVQGIPRFFSPLDRALLRGFQTFGGWLPSVSVPLVKEHMRQETANVVLPAEADLLKPYLQARNSAGVRMNVNLLGEALLGEEEARHRLERYLEALQLPEIEVLSVKISTIYSQISGLAREHTIRVLCDRLELLFREAAHLQFQTPSGERVPKFIYLDMEEYRDMSLTAQAFMRTLDRPGLEQASAGIALQAYVPDSLRTQCEINAWARERKAKGGGPITIRIVKGANLEMERVEASLAGWPQAPFKTKRETDANYKRMLHEAFRPENLAAVRVGIASHNLFDLAYGLVLAAAAEAGDCVQFEMLEGMANHQRRALFEQTQNLLLYAPACRREEFVNAIGYLIRRLDENTGPDNFLRHAFRLNVDSAEWRQLEEDFRGAFAVEISDAPRRTQDRKANQRRMSQEGTASISNRPFANEPDTDFALPQNAAWASDIISAWQPRRGDNAPDIPLIVAGSEVYENRPVRNCADPSRPGFVVGKYREATDADIGAAIDCAHRDDGGWSKLSPAERKSVLTRVADELRAARADLVGAAMANAGKIVTESDPEISEAIDFVEYYAQTAQYFFELPELRSEPKGVAVVVPPWNFPIAIPCGGIAAALAAGNRVILKPASPAVLVAWELCQCFWRAGISRKILQFLPCPGGTIGNQLVTHPGVNAVILTGGTATALAMLQSRPDMPLSAETGGKNATIVTSLSDREQAIKHVLRSAFSHAGQKCSATSLLLLEAEIYDDPVFRRMLVDAAASLRTGPAWDTASRVGPLIRPPSGDLETALKTLEPGESWALIPQRIGDNPCLWSPGIKYGVRPGSYTHLTEFFGPVLGVMRYTKLHEAIELVNQTGYGLTSGLESLDDREQAEWKRHVRAGNLYINKPTVGAIVLRQPFGGFGKSSVGAGLKAGGPNYVSQFMRFEDRPAAIPETSSDHHGALADFAHALQGLSASTSKEEIDRLLRAFRSYAKAWQEEFGKEHDDLKLLGEDNIRRYVPVREMRIRVHPDDSLFEIFARTAAARICGCRLIISESAACKQGHGCRRLELLTANWAGGIEFIEETEEELSEALRKGQAERVRFALPERVPEMARKAAAVSGAWLCDQKVLAAGRIELLCYLREQGVSHAYHRYGNLGGRASESRAEPA